LGDAKALYEIAIQHNKRVIVMSPVKGGLLAEFPVAAKGYIEHLAPQLSAASLAMRFCLSLEGVATILSGMSNMQQMEENIATFRAFSQISKIDSSAIAYVLDALSFTGRIGCTQCKYCSSCPHKIAIPYILNLYNHFREGRYTRLQASKIYLSRYAAQLSQCVNCKICEQYCPQNLKIAAHLKEINELFRESYS